MVKSDPLVVPDAVHAAAEPIGGHFIHPTSTTTTRNAAVGLASGHRAFPTTGNSPDKNKMGTAKAAPA